MATCALVTCDSPLVAKGLCRKHYDFPRRMGLTPISPPINAIGAVAYQPDKFPTCPACASREHRLTFTPGRLICLNIAAHRARVFEDVT